MLLLDRVWHDDEEKVEILALFGFSKLPSVAIFAAYVLEVVVINGLLECFDAGLIREFDDVSVINVDFKASLF